MSDIHVHPVNAAGKKEIRSPAVRALAVVVGLALLLPGAAALAANPIPGVDIIVRKKPSPPNPIIITPTGTDGAYQFKGLAAGSYDLSVGGKHVQTITVGNKGTLSGVLSSHDGKASITFNGGVGVVPDLPGERGVPGLSSGGVGVVPDLPGERTAPGLPSGGVGVVPDLPGERTAPGLPSRDGARIVETIDEQSSRTAASPKDAGKKAAGTPFGFGRGNTMDAGTGRGTGPSMSPGMIPGAGGPMGAPGPSPSPMGPGMGGPGSPMRP